MVGHCRDTLRLGTAGILCGWAPQGHSACRCALLGYSVIGHCRDTLRLGTAGILCGWAPQGHSAVGDCGWALQGYSAVGHCNQAPGGRGQHRLKI